MTRLRNADSGGTVTGHYTYAYDAAARMTGMAEGVNVFTYTYDGSSQVTSDSISTFGYDATGNRTNAGYVTGMGDRVTSDGVWSYTYDAAEPNAPLAALL